MSFVSEPPIPFYQQDEENKIFAPEDSQKIQFKIQEYLQSLKETWPVIQYLKKFETLAADLEPHALHLKQFKNIIILGTGGSSLGGQALISALHPSVCPVFHFVDNIDSFDFSVLLEHLNPRETGVICISKSGNTAETLMQLLTLLELWTGASETKLFDASSQVRIIVESSANALCEIAQKFSIPTIEHPKEIGGRFAVFTAVGLLPALIAGLDIQQLCQSAMDTFEQLIQNTEKSPVIASAFIHERCLKEEGIDQFVLFPYTNRLVKFCEWFCQLWAESLGKKDTFGNSFGTTPLIAVGTIDQHSQLQLYLEGPRNKHFRFFTLKEQHQLPSISLAFFHEASRILHGKTMGELMLAEQKATMDTLRAHGRLVSEVAIEKDLSCHILGALFMHGMLETLATAHLWGVNPFDQPAVEEGKKRTRSYLEERQFVTSFFEHS